MGSIEKIHHYLAIFNATALLPLIPVRKNIANNSASLKLFSPNLISFSLGLSFSHLSTTRFNAIYFTKSH
jgi:hypothetical protein